jgi:O-antigen/teichoic acid export membrane protein
MDRIVRAKRSSTALQLTTLVGGPAFGQILIVLSSPLLTRLYSVEDFGSFAIFASVIGIASYLATGRLELAVLLPRSSQDADRLVALSALLAVLVAVFVAVISAFITIQWYRGHELVHDHQMFWTIVAIGIVAAAAQLARTGRAARDQEFERIGLSRVWYGVATVSGQLLLGVFTTLGAFGLCLGNVLGYIWSAAVVSGHGRRGAVIKHWLSPYSRRRMRALLVRYRSYPLVAAPSSLANSVTMYSPHLLIAWQYGLKTAGAYLLASRVLMAPTGIIGKAIGHYYQGQSSRAIRSGEMRLLQRSFLRLTGALLAVAGPLVILTLWYAEPLFPLLFGSEWGSAGTIARVIVFAAAAQLVSAPTSSSLIVLGRQSLQLSWDLARMAVVTIVFVAAVVLEHGPVELLGAYTAALTAFYALHWCMCFSVIGGRAVASP